MNYFQHLEKTKNKHLYDKVIKYINFNEKINKIIKIINNLYLKNSLNKIIKIMNNEKFNQNEATKILIHIFSNHDNYFTSFADYDLVYQLLISIHNLPNLDDHRCDVYDECCVCYVKTKNKTICYHSICQDCNMKVINCPLCRKNLTNKSNSKRFTHKNYFLKDECNKLVQKDFINLYSDYKFNITERLYILWVIYL